MSLTVLRAIVDSEGALRQYALRQSKQVLTVLYMASVGDLLPLTSLSGFRIGVLADRLIKDGVVVLVGNHLPEEGRRR